MLLTIDQAAASLAISRRTLLREIAAGRLAVVEIRGSTRVAESDLAEYIEKSRTVRTASCPSSAMQKQVTGMSAYKFAANESSALLDQMLGVKTRSHSKRKSAETTSTAGSVNLKRAA